MRVDFSSRNPYSDGAEWKWRLKDKDDHVICRLPRLLTQQGLTTIERVDDAG